MSASDAGQPRYVNVLEDVASMRPRHVCLGCAAEGKVQEVQMELASMRPRHVCLGC